MSGAPLPIKAGDRYDQLTAVEARGSDDRGNRLWLFRCACGNELVWRVATARYNVSKLGFAACPDCYRKAGGWHAIAAKRANERA